MSTVCDFVLRILKVDNARTLRIIYAEKRCLPATAQDLTSPFRLPCCWPSPRSSSVVVSQIGALVNQVAFPAKQTQSLLELTGVSRDVQVSESKGREAVNDPYPLRLS